jgi:hypothetical protein
LKPTKLGMIFLVFLACNGEPISPDVGNEPASYPTNFSAITQSDTSILVTWEDVADATNYLVQAKTGSGTFATITDGIIVDNDSDWSDNNAAAIIGKSIKQVVFSGLSAGTAYDFTINPYNTGGSPDPNYKSGDSAPNTNATTTEVVVVEPPAHVTSFLSTALSNTSIKVSWADAVDVDKYVVLAKTGAGSFATVSDGTLVADDADWTNNNGAINVTQTTQEVTFSGLVKNTGYNFNIYPYNEGGSPDPNFKMDGTIPSTSMTTQNNASSAFDESLVSVATIDVSGSPFDITTYGFADKVFPQVSDGFAYAPKIVMAADNSGSYAIAWDDASAKTINLTLFNSDDTRNGADQQLITNSEGLGGFALNGSAYVLGHISGANQEKYTIQNFNSSFVSTFSTDLTGTTPLDQIWSKQSPIYFGSARIAVDQTASQIGVFLSHEMLWDDGTSKHQGGLIKFLDLNGNVLGGAGAGNGGNTGSDAIGGSFWFISHNVGTRMVALNGVFGVVGNGDAIPRALAGRVIDNGTWTNNSSIFSIDGSIGANDTRTQLGGFIPLSGSDYILTFSSEVGRNARDVNFMHLGSDLASIKQVWLTNYTVGTDAINVKTAKYGSNFVVAWEEVSGSTFKAMFAIVDADGNIIEAPQQFANIRFNRGDDFINFANGDVGWAIGSGTQLKIYRLKLVDLGG